MEPTEIPAGRLHLRPWHAGDEPVLLASLEDVHEQRWSYGLPAPVGPEQARAYVQERAPGGWRSGEELAWAVCDSTSGRVLADVALRNRGGGRWDVSYWCVPAERGRGIVPDALRAVMGFSFGALSAQRVEWMSEVGNFASRRAAEKAGFRVEGVRRGVLQTRKGPADAWLGAVLPQDPLEDTGRIASYADRTDGVVTLRRWRSSDAADVARACDDPETARWLPVPVPYTVEDGQRYVDGIVPTQWADGAAANVAVVDAVDGALLGAVGLTLREGIGEVGYWTAPWARGRGVAGRAATLHAGWGFEVLGLPRVELLADVENLASQRVAERAGWQREGVARAVRPAPREPALRRDMVIYARLPAQAV
jgi:RimJ/RimL family protein N-acetyltransferase